MKQKKKFGRRSGTRCHKEENDRCRSDKTPSSLVSRVSRFLFPLLGIFGMFFYFYGRWSYLVPAFSHRLMMTLRCSIFCPLAEGELGKEKMKLRNKKKSPNIKFHELSKKGWPPRAENEIITVVIFRLSANRFASTNRRINNYDSNWTGAHKTSLIVIYFYWEIYKKIINSFTKYF